ncbi:hypothetical protein KQ878_02270 [Mycoplasma zalophidermidis]|uniref:Uncharacterized protein n=1 Tax=Mycoplasma zalophidermidis TaxID=398174 RepID=A0ABS6DRQ8_9MOLU|nr:hypothetical protein [Mycoplasma zalophidermidis]MBU4693698.1 hypothetical protein [Mycoplasma zalophidermidis]
MSHSVTVTCSLNNKQKLELQQFCEEQINELIQTGKAINDKEINYTIEETVGELREFVKTEIERIEIIKTYSQDISIQEFQDQLIKIISNQISTLNSRFINNLDSIAKNSRRSKLILKVMLLNMEKSHITLPNI